VTQDVFDRVKEIALSQKQPPVDTNFKYDWGMNIDLYDDQGEMDTNEIEGEEGAENEKAQHPHQGAMKKKLAMPPTIY